MGVLYDYFRAPGEAEVRDHMAHDDAGSPVPNTFEGLELKAIDPDVVLGSLVAFAAGRRWGADLDRDRLVWPEDAEQAGEGPWVTALDNRVRDVLADIPPDRVPELADRWAKIEEFYGQADPEFLAEVITHFIGLAARAREQGESLYCWMCL